jgi:hypothetical protein
MEEVGSCHYESQLVFTNGHNVELRDGHIA